MFELGLKMRLKIGILTLISIGIVAVGGDFVPPWMFMGRPITGFRQANKLLLPDAPAAQKFDQYLDHFNMKFGAKWVQRFWHSSQHDNGNGTQILILGGEYAASANDVFYELYPHVQYARKLGAGLWTLEHRFYGQSQPFGNLETKNLAYLSSRQALEDIAFFIRSQNAALNITNPKWVLIGGSYAGSLALWLRQKYPTLTVGAVASSAFIDFRLEFYEYLMYVEEFIKTYDLECFNNIATAFSTFWNKLVQGDSDEKEDLSETFSFQPQLQNVIFTSEIVGLIYSTLISYMQIPLQYNRNNITTIDLDSFCLFMQPIYGDVSREYMNIGEVINKFNRNLRGGNLNTSTKYPAFVSYLQNPTISDPDNASTRAWFWQVCNEFGTFPTTSGQRSIFGNHVSFNFYINLCTDVFGPQYHIVNTQNGMSKTFKQYGSITTYNATNVVASRGLNDPWSLLALKEPTNNPSIVTALLNNTGHCGDMGELSGTYLAGYYNMVVENIKKWIEEAQ